MEPGPLWSRYFRTFYEPGTLGDGLAAHPRWVGALILGAVLTVASVLIVPAEAWEAMMREQAMSSGQPVPENMEAMGATIMRVGAVVGGAVFWFVWAFLTAGLAMFAFAFVLGDDGRYRQYLSATAHSMLIVATGSLLLAPLRAIRSDAQLTLSVGTFFGDLGSGYLARLLTSMDLFMLWSVVVLAIFASRIDRRRSVGSAAGVLFTFILGLLALFALIPRPV